MKVLLDSEEVGSIDVFGNLEICLEMCFRWRSSKHISKHIKHIETHFQTHFQTYRTHEKEGFI
jgi:hypothetical protein